LIPLTLNLKETQKSRLNTNQLINQDDISEVMELTNAKKYMDCSVVLGTGINKVFKESIRVHVSNNREESSYQSDNGTEKMILMLDLKVKKSFSEVRDFDTTTRIVSVPDRRLKIKKMKEKKKNHCILQ